MTAPDFTIDNLGERTIPSPIILSTEEGDLQPRYAFDHQRLHYRIRSTSTEFTGGGEETSLIEVAGPRQKIFFNPAEVHAGIVTCGGLCPGLNDVIRALVMALWYRYGVRKITGIRYGYRGFLPEKIADPVSLTPDIVEDIHQHGGTMLASSRGFGDRTSAIVDSIEKMELNQLFVIGGDGTQKGALAISKEAAQRNIRLSVIGIPKTIDNDLSYVDRTFGFNTAVAKAAESVAGAHVEAHDAVGGIGIVKVMGRESGFIAAQAALAVNDVNFVLIPEVPFEMTGKNGLLSALDKRLEEREHALILVSEGAGQDLMKDEAEKDLSGNKKLSDIGIYLCDQIKEYFKGKKKEVNLKYIDPSYIIRSVPANPADSIYCLRLGTHAVHAAMAGKTGALISLIHGTFVHVPIELAVSERKTLDPESELWRDVLAATGMPPVLKN